MVYGPAAFRSRGGKGPQIPGFYLPIYASLIVYRLAPGVSPQAEARVQAQIYSEHGGGEDSAELLGK